MSYELSVIIENAIFIAIFLVCLFGAYFNYKRAKTLPGVGLVALGLMMYGIYALLAFTGPGFTGSFIRDFSKVGRLNTDNFVYFVSFALRLGLLPIVVGVYGIARSLKTKA